MNEAVIELLNRMQGLLRITVTPPYFKSIFHFRKEVSDKISYIKKQEKLK